MNVISGEKKNCVILVRGRNHLDGLVDERKIMRVTGCPLISAHKESIYRVMCMGLVTDGRCIDCRATKWTYTHCGIYKKESMYP